MRLVPTMTPIFFQVSVKHVQRHKLHFMYFMMLANEMANGTLHFQKWRIDFIFFDVILVVLRFILQYVWLNKKIRRLGNQNILGL